MATLGLEEVPLRLRDATFLVDAARRWSSHPGASQMKLYQEFVLSRRSLNVEVFRVDVPPGVVEVVVRHMSRDAPRAWIRDDVSLSTAGALLLFGQIAMQAVPDPGFAPDDPLFPAMALHLSKLRACEYTARVVVVLEFALATAVSLVSDALPHTADMALAVIAVGLTTLTNITCGHCGTERTHKLPLCRLAENLLMHPQPLRAKDEQAGRAVATASSFVQCWWRAFRSAAKALRCDEATPASEHNFTDWVPPVFGSHALLVLLQLRVSGCAGDVPSAAGPCLLARCWAAVASLFDVEPRRAPVFAWLSAHSVRCHCHP